MIRIKGKWTWDIGFVETRSVLTVKKSICASRYTSFQFRMAIRMTTNTFLFLSNYPESNRCTFCDGAPEILWHWFLTFPVLLSYWNNILEYASVNGLRQICIRTKKIGDSKSYLPTHIATVAKNVLHKSQRRETRPSYNQFKEFLKRIFKLRG